MAKVKTIDDIVKRSLLNHDLTLHYYVPFLLHALRGLEELHYDVLQSFSSEKLSVGDTGVVELPSDLSNLISVGVIEGDKVRPLVREDKLLRSSNDGVALDEVEVEDYFWNNSDVSSLFDLEYKGRTFERGLLWKDGYTFVRDENILRIDNRSKITEVLVTYLTDPKEVGGKSVINPYAQQTLEDWISWKWAKHNPTNRFDPQIKKAEYYNSLRILKGRMNPISTNDLIHSVRKSAN